MTPVPAIGTAWSLLALRLPGIIYDCDYNPDLWSEEVWPGTVNLVFTQKDSRVGAVMSVVVSAITTGISVLVLSYSAQILCMRSNRVCKTPTD
jgi:hypothetical protein